MSNNYFKFRQFTIWQERCAMKVGTDGTLLGAWARGGDTILDIGTGTGLISMMMAQRFPGAKVFAIDIDHDAVMQASENVASSPFADRIQIVECDIRQYSSIAIESIVCNPPFFVDSLECPDNQRTLARHTSSLSYGELMDAVVRLLDDEGEFSVIIPFDCKTRLENEASLVGLFKVRECAVKTTPQNPPRRYLMAFRKHHQQLEMTEGIIETKPGVRSVWYQQLTKDFYL